MKAAWNTQSNVCELNALTVVRNMTCKKQQLLSSSDFGLEPRLALPVTTFIILAAAHLMVVASLSSKFFLHFVFVELNTVSLILYRD